MASVIDKTAQKLYLTRNENSLSGYINGISVKITFVKHIRKNANIDKRYFSRSPSVAFFEIVFQPKYEYVTVDVFVSRDGETELPELSDFLDTQYENFKTSLPVYLSGRFQTVLYQRDTLNIKACYVADFMIALTGFLKEHGY